MQEVRRESEAVAGSSKIIFRCVFFVSDVTAGLDMLTDLPDRALSGRFARAKEGGKLFA